MGKGLVNNDRGGGDGEMMSGRGVSAGGCGGRKASSGEEAYQLTLYSSAVDEALTTWRVA